MKKVQENQKNQKKKNKGFTLVELIIVIAIMVVLIGLLAPQFVKYVEKSKESTDVQNLDSIITVCQAFLADQSSPAFTVTVDGGVFKVSGITASTWASSDECASVTGVAVKGNWGTGTNALSATSDATGKITYTGEATYLKVNADGKGFEGK